MIGFWVSAAFAMVTILVSFGSIFVDRIFYDDRTPVIQFVALAAAFVTFFTTCIVELV